MRHEDRQGEDQSTGRADERDESRRLEERTRLGQRQREDRDDGEDDEPVGHPLEKDRAEDAQAGHADALPARTARATSPGGRRQGVAK
jgi:hypothetical protein